MLCGGYSQSQIRVELLQTQADNTEAKQGEASVPVSSLSLHAALLCTLVPDP